MTVLRSLQNVEIFSSNRPNFDSASTTVSRSIGADPPDRSAKIRSRT